MSHHNLVRKAAVAAILLIAMAWAAEAQTPMGVMFIKNNRVGIGTDNPTDPLHVKSTTAGAKTMMRLTNNGAPLAQYEDSSLGVSWGLQPLSNGDFSITKNGTGGAEFLIRQSGQVLIGPGPATVFNLTPGGSLIINGTLTQGSSRELKQDFAVLDGREVLTQVAGLEIAEWSYKRQGARHVGPMAEDFHAAFGLGDSAQGLAPSDVAGVTLLALQGLNQVVEDKDREIDELRAELAELKATVAALAAGR